MYDHYDKLTVTEATQIQNELREKIDLRPLTKNIKTVAGADISFNKYSTTVYAGIVVLSFPGLKLLSRSMVKAEVHFPYVPGYLAFREISPLLKAWELLAEKPDVLILDGHGIAHPRKMGIAAHFGTLIDHPTVGCAKKKLYGKYVEPDEKAGSSTFLYNKTEVIGTVLRTRNKVKPVFVSPGNLISMEEAKELVMQCAKGYRLPEPTRLAHKAVNLFRTGEIEEGFESDF